MRDGGEVAGVEESGDSLVLQLSGVETEFFNGADYIAVTFTSGTGLATFGTDLEVLLMLDEEHFVHGYYVQGGDHTAMYVNIYFCHKINIPKKSRASSSYRSQNGDPYSICLGFYILVTLMRCA